MYRFQVIAHTQTGESIGLVGSTPELGQWDVANSIRLQTDRDRYPLWITDIPIPLSFSSASSQIAYQYVRFRLDGSTEWETVGHNRRLSIPSEPPDRAIVIDDGAFGYVQPEPFGYLDPLPPPPAREKSPTGLKIVVIGSSVAVGYKAWFLQGWTELLAQTLHQRYGHQLVNVSESGANVSRTIARFPTVVAPENPDIVIIALSLGNEGLAYCPPQERRAVQRRFESGLQQLVKMTRALGARPILGSVYPHGEYGPEQACLLRDTHQRMQRWGVPILDWLAALQDGQGRWQPGISCDPAHPNTTGHQRMYAAIDLSLFQLDKPTLEADKPRLQYPLEIPLYQDGAGFSLSACPEVLGLRIRNTSPHAYTIAPYWQELQTALKTQPSLVPGIYIAQSAKAGTAPYLAVETDGTLSTTVEVPAGAHLDYGATFPLFAPNCSHLLFYDGHLGLLKEDDQHLWIINEADHPYNIQPMWGEVRRALQAMPQGVYHDPQHPEAPFRTLMIGPDGLESRVKAPPKSALLLQYQCPLSAISRVAILSLGDRCAVRMMLYKMEYDGPAFPFDLTRTTCLSDVADIIENRFSDMWNPALLHYDAEEGRIYHRKWSGLSFAHEVEPTDDPVHNMWPIYERMRIRYSARSRRFWYTLEHCDKVLFVRTGGADRGSVIDLVHKLTTHSQGKPFHLLIFSPQDSQEFAGLPQVLHYNLEFNPDRMYGDPEHWQYCAGVMRDILTSLGISSQNLFWCPPH